MTLICNLYGFTVLSCERGVALLAISTALHGVFPPALGGSVTLKSGFLGAWGRGNQKDSYYAHAVMVLAHSHRARIKGFSQCLKIFIS